MLMVLLSLFLVGCNSKTEKSLIQINKDQDAMINTLIENNNNMSHENKLLVQKYAQLEENQKLYEKRIEVLETQNIAYQTTLNELNESIGYAYNNFDDWLYFYRRHQKNIDYSNGIERLDGFIKNIDLLNNLIDVDEVEMLGYGDEVRLRELGYDTDHSMPGGFLLHNEVAYTRAYIIHEDTQYFFGEVY